ncbi:MAG: Membrane protein insertase YidC [Verrucomicrobiota bacterium]|jgi:YidC/Oxa1 family membrane protein insertase
MDRKGKIAVAILVFCFVIWQWYYSRELEKSRAAVPGIAAEQKVLKEESSAGTSRVPEQPAETKATTEVPVAFTASESVPARLDVIRTPLVQWQFTSRGGGLSSATLTRHQAEGGRPVVINQFGGIPIGALTEAFEKPIFEDFQTEFAAEANEITFRRLDPRQLEIVKRFSVSPSARAQEAESVESYKVDLELIFRNRSGGPLTLPNYALRVGSAAPLHAKDLPMHTGFNRLNAGNSKFTDINWFSGGGVFGFGKKDRPVYLDPGEISWVGVTNQYYATVVSPLDAPGSEALARRFQISDADWSASGRAGAPSELPYAVDGGVRLPVVTLDAGKESRIRFSIFAGPREHRLLKSLGGGQEQILDFGMFSIVSRTLLWSMNGLKSALGSYAAAIIVLTLIIKSALWPLQNKSTQSMKRMQELQPRMNEIKLKYGDDPQRMNQEIMGLYKKHGVNPMSGCLPMLVQIPIFFGFYNMLGKAVELRNSSFLWVKDLSQPDTVAIIAGYPLNVLPIFMAATMLLQMRLSPQTGDPVQQRLFMFMPLIFVVFCYNFASALALYWTVQNVFSIIQLLVTRRQSAVGAQSVFSTPQRNR